MDKYDGRYYYINGNTYTAKQATKYLTAIGFSEEESGQYMSELRKDWRNAK